MIFSVEQTFSDAQVVAATAVSDNVIDLGETGTVLNGPAPLVRDIGRGTPIPVRIQLIEDATAPTDTLDVTMEVSEDEAFTTPIVVATAPTITGGEAGTQAMINYVPYNTNLRYLRLNYTIAGGPYTITAGIVLADQSADGLAGV